MRKGPQRQKRPADLMSAAVKAARIEFRAALTEDFDYCAALYFAAMGEIIRQLNLDMNAQVSNLSQQWKPEQVRIIILSGVEIGWLQTTTTEDALFLGQLFLDLDDQPQYSGSCYKCHSGRAAGGRGGPA